MSRLDDRPGDLYRSMATWLSYGPWLGVAGMVFGAIASWRRGGPARSGVSMFVLPTLVLLWSWWFARKARPLLLANAERADRELDPPVPIPDLEPEETEEEEQARLQSEAEQERLEAIKGLVAIIRDE